jgi:hypothetical protein
LTFAVYTRAEDAHSGSRLTIRHAVIGTLGIKKLGVGNLVARSPSNTRIGLAEPDP